MLVPDYISFDYIDNILKFISNKMSYNNTFCKLKFNKYFNDKNEYRNKILKEFNITQRDYNGYKFEKSKYNYITMYLEDLVMSDKEIPDNIKDEICSYINNERISFKELCSNNNI